MGAMSPWHWAIVLIVLVLLFGSTRLPGAARGLGKSLRIFKSEMREMTGDTDSSAASARTEPEASPSPQALPAADQNAGREQLQGQPAAPAAQPSAQSQPQAHVQPQTRPASGGTVPPTGDQAPPAQSQPPQ